MVYTTLKSLFTAIADAIRGKEGSTAEIVADDFPRRITSIQTQDHTIEDALIEGTVYGAYTNDRVTEIAPYKFFQMRTIHSVNIPNVTSIGECAFTDCALKEVTALNLERVGFYAFASAALVSITAPKLRYVEEKAFMSCSALKRIEMINGFIWSNSFLYSGIKALVIRHESDQITSLYLGGEDTAEDVFADTPIAYGTGYIYVPRALVDSYKATENWSNLASQIRALEDYTVDGTITGALDESKI